jgi:hypothetical protein
VRCPYPGGVGVPRLYRPCSSRLPWHSFRNPRLLCDEPEPEAVVLAWTDEELARKETSSSWEMAASQAEEDVAAAARAWPRHLLARCRRPPLGGGPFARVTIRGRAWFRRGWNQHRGCCCSPCRCQNLQEQFVCSMRMLFRDRRGLNTIVVFKKLCLLSSCFEHHDLSVNSRIVYPNESYFSWKVMSEVSVSRRRRSPSARSVLPLTCALIWSKDSIIGTVEKVRKSFSTRVLGLVR